MRNPAVIICIMIVVVLISGIGMSSSLADQSALRNNFNQGSIIFTENQGQFGEKTKFRGESGNVIFYFCRDEVAYLFVRNTDELIEDDLQVGHDNMPGRSDMPRYKKEAILVKAQFIGANPNAEIAGVNRLPHNNNYFLGRNPSEWRTNVPNYSSIIYNEIYPGIDLRYYGNKSSLKYDFIVHPGADVSQIQIKYDGIDGLAISGAGDLQLQTEFGMVAEKAPYAYQDINGVTQQITTRYELIEPGLFGFRVADDYDRSQPLIIDPQLVYSTYFGGSADDEFSDIDVDSEGNFYLFGRTQSADFQISNPYQGNLGGAYDLCIVKFDSSGQNLIFSTYLGGSGYEYPKTIALDEIRGRFYILGVSESLDFPLVNPFQGNNNGVGDFAIVVMPLSGDSLEYSTYFGGTYHEYFGSLNIDNQGNAYVTGSTPSTDFPLVNPLYSTHAGDDDAFIAKFNGSDSSYNVVFSTFLGGAEDDRAGDIVIGNDGRIYISGYTESSDYPTINAYDSTINDGCLGYGDVFVTIVSPNGDSLLYSTFLGGNGTDRANGIALDSEGNIYITGSTGSSNYPLVNEYTKIFSGGDNWWGDVFVSVLSSDGSSLLYGTYFGGNNGDCAEDISVNDSGIVYISGFTRSADFPVVNAYDYSWNGHWDVFAAALDINGGCCLFSTYLGGSGNDEGARLEIVDDSLMYLCGYTSSDDFPLVNAIDYLQSSKEGFVSIFSLDGMDITPGTISGNVYDNSNNSIQDVRVTLLAHGFRDTTGANGMFEFNNICPGIYDISLSHYLFFDTVITDIFLDEQGHTNNLNIVMDSAWYQQGENCFNPYVITDTTFPIVVSGNIGTFNNDYELILYHEAGMCWQGDYSCRAGLGPDAVYLWTVPSTGYYNFELCDVTANDFDTDLFIWQNTCPWEPEFPRDFICGAWMGCGPLPFDPRAKLNSVFLSQGEEILINIDSGSSWDSGNFELTISLNDSSGDCDFYTVGDVNGDNSFNGLDVVYAVNFFKGGSSPSYICDCPPHGSWFVEGDVNGSCDFNGLDVTYGVAYFKGGPGPIPCSDCPPLRLSSSSNGDNNDIIAPEIQKRDYNSILIKEQKTKVEKSIFPKR